MSNVSDKVVPKRKERLQAGNAFGGKACHLLKEAEVAAWSTEIAVSARPAIARWGWPWPWC